MTGNSGQWRLAFWQGDSDGPPDLLPSYLDFDALGCLNAPPTGLGNPPLRPGDRAKVQRDGTSMYGDWYESRAVSFTVTFQNDGCPGCPGVRQRVAQVMRSWNRNCSDARLLIIADCTPETDTFPEDVLPDPDDRATLGPYLLTGRPREAQIRWERSDIGVGHIDFRFDSVDHRIGIVQPNINGSITSETCVTLDTANDTDSFINAGDLPACLDITYEGELTGPVVLTFTDIGVGTITFNGTISSGETVTLNTCDNLAVSTIFGSRDAQEYSGMPNRTIAPGFNGTVELSTGDVNDDGSVTVCWSQDVIGI